MKNTFFIYFLFFASFAMAQPNRSRAEAFHRLLTRNQYDSCMAFFDENLHKKITPPQLATVWEAVNKQMGGYQALTKTATPNGGKVWLLTCKFAEKEIDLKLAFDEKQQISGFFFVPSKPQLFFKDAGYSSEKNVIETSVTIENGAYKLQAMLCTPIQGSKFPVVVLVHGSGPADKDLSINSTKIFRDFALGLAAEGIATLRYDKRTFVYGEKSAANIAQITVEDETVSDAVAALRLAKTLPNIDSSRVFLLGHSLGAMMAPRIAAQAKSLAGVIAAAAPARPLEDLVLEQMSYIAQLQPNTPESTAELAKLRQQVARVKSPALSLATPTDSLPLGLPASYWLDLRTYSPTAVAASQSSLPYLFLQGEADYQVTMEDLMAWEKALERKRNASFKRYAGLFHLFIPTQSKTGKGTPADYEAAGNVDKQVILDVAAFILAKR